jgi:hypothetical protein
MDKQKVKMTIINIAIIGSLIIAFTSGIRIF